MNGRNVGYVTSAGYSFTENCAIGMGYVKPGQGKPGAELEIDVRGKREKAVVVPLPFYKRAK